MKKGTTIYYVEEQDQYGKWDPTGAAFLSESKCRARVMDLDIKWIMENIEPMDIREQVLTQFSEEQIEEMSFKEIEDELRKADEALIYELMENESLGGQCGGFYSFETLSIEDGTEEDDGLAVHSRRNAS